MQDILPMPVVCESDMLEFCPQWWSSIPPPPLCLQQNDSDGL